MVCRVSALGRRDFPRPSIGPLARSFPINPHPFGAALISSPHPVLLYLSYPFIQDKKQTKSKGTSCNIRQQARIWSCPSTYNIKRKLFLPAYSITNKQTRYIHIYDDVVLCMRRNTYYYIIIHTCSMLIVRAVAFHVVALYIWL